MEGKDLDPRPARLGHDAGRLGHDHRARPQADARHGRRVPVAAAARRPNQGIRAERSAPRDRKSTRLNSSHEWISYAVFCLKKKNKNYEDATNSHITPHH